jgi:hypothetical protein
MATSFILASYDLDDVGNEHKALNKTSNAQPVYYRVERNLPGWSHLTGYEKIRRIAAKVVADDDKNDNADSPSQNIHEVPSPPRESLNNKINIDKTPQPRGERHTEADHYSTCHPDYLECPDDGMLKRSQDNIRHGEQHDKGQSNVRYDIHQSANFFGKPKKACHTSSPPQNFGKKIIVVMCSWLFRTVY